MVHQKYKVKGRSGEELCVYLPEGKIEEVDRVRGQYFTRSKFVLWALDRAILEASSGTMKFEKIPPGATVGSQAPSGKDSPSAPPSTMKEIIAEEGLACVS